MGDPNWQDCAIEADVFLAGGDVEIGGRYAAQDKLGYRWILTQRAWLLNWQDTPLASGQITEFKAAEWHHLRLEMKGDQIIGFVDGKQLASVTDSSRAAGLVFLASTYDRNLFDNVRVGLLRPKARPSLDAQDHRAHPHRTARPQKYFPLPPLHYHEPHENNPARHCRRPAVTS